MKIKDLRDDFHSSGIAFGELGTESCEIILYDSSEWNEIKDVKIDLSETEIRTIQAI